MFDLAAAWQAEKLLAVAGMHMAHFPPSFMFLVLMLISYSIL